jgi:hypothetical protein
MRTVMKRIVLASLLMCCFSVSSTIAFTSSVVSLHKKLITTIIVRHSISNDFDGINIGDDNEAGQALALEFSREVQQRQQQQAAALEENEVLNQRLLSEEELRFLNRKPFARRQEFIASGRVKEIGSTTSAGFFSGHGPSLYSFPMDFSPRRNQPQRQDKPTISPLFIPTMAVIIILSVYLTFGEGEIISANEVDDWNAAAVPGTATVEQVMPSSVYL